MPIQKFIMTRDINGFNGFGLPFSNNKYQAVLEGNSEDTVTVPQTGLSDYPNVVAVFAFQPGSSVWVALNETATYPSGSFSSCNSELNPEGRVVKSGDVLHFITTDDQDEIGVSFYATT